MPCSWLSLDAMDISGEMHLDVVSRMLCWGVAASILLCWGLVAIASCHKGACTEAWNAVWRHCLRCSKQQVVAGWVCSILLACSPPTLCPCLRHTLAGNTKHQKAAAESSRNACGRRGAP
jgi:hypothetical protein